MSDEPTIHVTINGQEMDLTEKEAKDLLTSLTRYFEQQQKKPNPADVWLRKLEKDAKRIYKSWRAKYA